MPETSAKPAGALFKPVCAADLPEVEMQWLWKPYLPKGVVSILAGDPGMCKSYMTCKLAADLSTGRALPGQSPIEPQKVLFLSGEDDGPSVIIPRLKANQANLKNIFIFDVAFTLSPQKIRDMHKYIAQHAITFVSIDPVQAFTGGKMDIHRANEVRGLMAQLNQTAKETGATIMTVMHLRKGSSDANAQGKDIYRILGSIDFVGACRSAMMVQKAKDGLRYMEHVKSNYAMIGPALHYDVVNEEFKWGGVVSEETKKPVSKVPLRLSKTKEWLREALKEGERPAAEVLEEFSVANIASERTLRSAMPEMISTNRRQGRWYWRLKE